MYPTFKWHARIRFCLSTELVRQRKRICPLFLRALSKRTQVKMYPGEKRTQLWENVRRGWRKYTLKIFFHMFTPKNGYQKGIVNNEKKYETISIK